MAERRSDVTGRKRVNGSAKVGGAVDVAPAPRAAARRGPVPARAPRTDLAPARRGAVDAEAPAPGRGRRPAAWSNVVASQDEQFRLKRDALLREAARAFSARGFHSTSLDDVAASLGVTKAALYHYVSSKQEILFECHSLSLDLGDQALAYARAHGRTGLERVSLLARRYIELITGEVGRFAVLSEFHALEPDGRAAILKRRDAFERAMRGMIQDGIQDGSVRAVDPRLAVFFFMGAVNWMTRWYRPDGDRSGAEIAAAFEDMLTKAVCRD
jgi:AcrR family transcriptional regulator